MNLTKLALLTAVLAAPLMAANAGENHGWQQGPRHAPQQTCREYTQKVTIGGHTQYAYGTACLTPGGDWKIVSTERNRQRFVENRYRRHHEREGFRDARRDGPNGIVWLTDNRRGW